MKTIIVIISLFGMFFLSGFNQYEGWLSEEQVIIQAEIDTITRKLGFNPVEGMTIRHLSPDYPLRSCWSTLNCFGAFSYTDEEMQGLITHEIGHRLIQSMLWSDLNYSLGYYNEKHEYVHVSGNHPVSGKFVRTNLGFYLPQQPYCQNCAHVMPYGQSYKEDFADMFMSWVFNWWDETPAGELRKEYMNKWVEETFGVSVGEEMTVRENYNGYNRRK